MPINQAAADRAVQVINSLTHTKGNFARKPFNLRPWQEHRIIRPLLGTLRAADGLRQYRTAFISMPRKNGKTEIGAAIATYMLVSEAEEGGEIYSAAIDREQASLVFRVVAQMVRNDETLSRLCRIVDSHRAITYLPTNSVYRAIPADAPHAHGYNANAVIYDEIHNARNPDLWNVLKTSMGARTQPLMVAITTAGHDRNTICFELYDRACKVRDGLIDDPTFFQCIYEAPESADWTDEAVWHDANPALDDFRQLDEMRASFAEAQTMPARETVFKQFYLNMWVESVSRWLPSEAWKACAGANALDLEGRECYAGLDLAYRSDFAALVLVFPMDDGTYSMLPFFWLPKEGNRDLKTEPYAGWARAEHVRLCPGPSTDFPAIRATINELQSRFSIQKVAVDPWNARQLSSELMEDGFEVVEFRQTMSNFNEPTKLFEQLVLEGRIRHDDNPILNWMVSNVCVETDSSGNYRPSKKKSSEKIDGAVARVMALAIATQQAATRSIYNDYGNLAL